MYCIAFPASFPGTVLFGVFCVLKVLKCPGNLKFSEEARLFLVRLTLDQRPESRLIGPKGLIKLVST